MSSPHDPRPATEPAADADPPTEVSPGPMAGAEPAGQPAGSEELHDADPPTAAAEQWEMAGEPVSVGPAELHDADPPTAAAAAGAAGEPESGGSEELHDADPPTTAAEGEDAVAEAAEEPETADSEEAHDADPEPAVADAGEVSSAPEADVPVVDAGSAGEPEPGGPEELDAAHLPTAAGEAAEVAEVAVGEPDSAGPEELDDTDPPTAAAADEDPHDADHSPAAADVGGMSPESAAEVPVVDAGEPESGGPEELHDADPPTAPVEAGEATEVSAEPVVETSDAGSERESAGSEELRDAGEEIESDELPQLSDEELEKALEALLLVVDSPVEEDVLANAVGAELGRVTATLTRMATALAEQERGFDLRRAGGGWRYYTRDKYAPYVEKMLLDGQRAKLTRAALETLAVIAYRQPVTRARVAAVRGVNCDGVIRTLLARGLVEETGTDVETGGFLYRTTELFLERLGLSSLDDLPPIAPLLPDVDAIDDV